MSNRACPGIRHFQSTDNAISELAETAKSAAGSYYTEWEKVENHGAEIEKANHSKRCRKLVVKFIIHSLDNRQKPRKGLT